MCLQLHTTGVRAAAHRTGVRAAAHSTGVSAAAHSTGVPAAAHSAGVPATAHGTGSIIFRSFDFYIFLTCDRTLCAALRCATRAVGAVPVNSIRNWVVATAKGSVEAVCMQL